MIPVGIGSDVLGCGHKNMNVCMIGWPFSRRSSHQRHPCGGFLVLGRICSKSGHRFKG